MPSIKLSQKSSRQKEIFHHEPQTRNSIQHLNRMQPTTSTSSHISDMIVSVKMGSNVSSRDSIVRVIRKEVNYERYAYETSSIHQKHKLSHSLSPISFAVVDSHEDHLPQNKQNKKKNRRLGMVSIRLILSLQLGKHSHLVSGIR